MNLKLILATTTAIGVLMTASMALADGGFANTDDNGDNNNLLIVQSGSSNSAGTAAVAVTQSGDQNALTLTQDGNSNFAGLAASTPAPFATQTGDHNLATVTQTFGEIDSFAQSAAHSSGVVATTNTATITQTSDFGPSQYNSHPGTYIGSISQTYTGLTGGGDGNGLTITQSASQAAPNYLHSAVIGTASQNGTSDTLGITQKQQEYLGSATQVGNSDTGTVTQGGPGLGNYTTNFQQSGSNDTGSLSLTGSNNGGNNLNPGGVFTHGFAAASGAPANSFVQIGGSNNQADLSISGNGNQYGLIQNGSSNTATGLNVAGDHNALGVSQTGTGNNIDLATIGGSNDDIGLVQNGMDNELQASSGASNSAIRSSEVGKFNDVKIDQSGGTNNLVNVGITGDSNVLNVRQEYSGSNDSASVTINGDNNNSAGLGNFTGDAAIALGTTGLNKGDIIQNGSNDLVALQVSSSDNIFATFQADGGPLGSSITGTIGGGTGNQAVVTQTGAHNNATIAITGFNNNVGISQ